MYKNRKDLTKIKNILYFLSMNFHQLKKKKMIEEILIVRMEVIFIAELQKEVLISYTSTHLGHICLEKQEYPLSIFQTILYLTLHQNYEKIVIYYSHEMLENVIDNFEHLMRENKDIEESKAKSEKKNVVSFKYEPKLLSINEYLPHFYSTSTSYEYNCLELKQFLFEKLIKAIQMETFSNNFMKKRKE